MIAREMESNIIVDFRQFPARTVHTITNDQGLGVFRFDSDSSNYFVQTIPAGTYHTTWELIGIAENKNYKAKMLNHNQGTVADRRYLH